MVFLKHLIEDGFILHYPCCKTFISEGFCANCLAHCEGGDYIDVAAAAAADTEGLFPYLLYVGHSSYDSVMCLHDMPVCHIDEELAWRIFLDLSIHKTRYFALRDTPRGQRHEFHILCDNVCVRVCDALKCYILLGGRFSKLVPPRLPLSQMSRLSLAVQHVCTLERCVREIKIVFNVLISGTVDGKRYKQWMVRCSTDAYAIYHLQWCIMRDVTKTLKKIHREDLRHLWRVHLALK